MKLNSNKIAAALILSGLLLLTLAGVALAAPPWPDASDSWWVSNYGVTETEVGTVADGYPDGFFKPANDVTRGQFAKMAVNGFDLATLDRTVPTFTDVAKGSTFYTYIEGAFEENLVGGYATPSGLEYRPNNNISRQQANSILGRYLAQAEMDATGIIRGDGGLTYASLDLWYAAWGSFYLNGFFDAGSVAAVHRASTAYLVYHGVVKGSNGRLNPLTTLNRAQAAAMVLRVRAEAVAITTPPPPPTGLQVTPPSPGRDTTPQVSGIAIPNSPVAVYDTFEGATTKLTETSTNEAGVFYADLSTPLVDGTHSFTAKVKNAAGLVSAASTPVPYLLDTVPPAGAITAPVVPAGQPDAAVNSAKPAFTATATDERSGVKDVEFQVAEDTTPLVWQTISVDSTADVGNAYAAVWPDTGLLGAGLADGQFKMQAIVTDKAGNQKTMGPVNLTVDTKVPTVAITAPLGTSPHYTTDHTPDFTADAADAPKTPGITASGVSKVEFFYVAWSATPPSTFAGFTLLSTDTSPGYAAANYPPLPNGRYIFAVRATDRAGNTTVLTYAAGVTQEVIIDDAPPVLIINEPDPGELVPDDSEFNITWTLTDAWPPAAVKIEVSNDNGASWSVLAAATPNDGTYPWTVPDLGADDTDYRIRITGVDQAGNTTVTTSGAFTVYDKPNPVTGLTGSDPDAVNAGVDGRDFTASWTVSTSADVVSQRVYVLPDGVDPIVTGPGAHAPLQTYANNTTATWTGTAGMTMDSDGGALAAGNYKIWIVVTDADGWTAAASVAVAAAAP